MLPAFLLGCCIGRYPSTVYGSHQLPIPYQAGIGTHQDTTFILMSNTEGICGLKRQFTEQIDSRVHSSAASIFWGESVSLCSPRLVSNTHHSPGWLQILVPPRSPRHWNCSCEPPHQLSLFSLPTPSSVALRLSFLSFLLWRTRPYTACAPSAGILA